jgi:uncharacterized C2H2 Zn-finger protein
MIEERCIRCGKLIVATSRSRFEKRYTDHVTADHGAPKTVPGGIRR